MTSTNDGKDVKSNETSGPKGKSYYIELYKFLESRLSEGGDAHDRTNHLCVAWRSVHSLCQHSAPSTHTHLINWLQRHTSRAVLQTEWQTPKRKDDRKSLEEAIDSFIEQIAGTSQDGDSLSWEAQLVARGQWFKRVLDTPWDHPVLTLLLNPNGAPPTDDEVLVWLKEERGVTFVMRLQTLVGEKCDDIAVSLASTVMERARAGLPPVVDSDEPTEPAPVENATPTFADKLKGEAGFTPDVWDMLIDIEFVLLHKRDSKRCIALAKQTPLQDAYALIERLQKRLEASPREKRLWKNSKEVAILIAQVVIARCMVVKSCVGVARHALYCCARLLARLLVARLPAAADALAAQALTARHLHTLAQAVDKQLSPGAEMKPYVCELYVRAITAGMNELERLKLKTEKETDARLMEKTLSSWFVQLGEVLASSARIACECTLTAFSLHPSQYMYERIDAAPPFAPVLADSNDTKEETVQSEFGSWANDSRSQTNLVKTSETLNMKHTQNQANVLSTAIFNEGEALGLSPELCQDIAVLLSGPRVKTLSWDMDRTLLLKNCRAYCDMTHEGTRVLTRELKYLNIDPQQYQHLPEEKDDDENDPYYGIERGYEHLAVLEEPEEIWEDANDDDETDSVSSIEKYYITPRRKKKTKRQSLSSEEDSDPLSLMAEAKKLQMNERPHSKERSKPRKKKSDLVDPLDIDVPSQNEGQTIPKNEPKVKKERKKKEKVPKVIGGKLASLVGIKVKPKKKSRDITSLTALVSNSYNNSQDKKSLKSVNSGSFDPSSINDKPISRPKPNSQEMKFCSGMMKNQGRVTNNMVGNRCAPLHHERPSNLTKMQYRPQTSNAIGQPSPIPSDHNRSMIHNFKNYPEDVRANLSKLLEYRRKQDQQQKFGQQNKVPHTPPRNPAIIRQDIQLQANINPKSVTIPAIPKSFINKEHAEQLAEYMRRQNKFDSKESVIQYAKKGDVKKNRTASSSMDYRRAQYSSSMKMTDNVNPSYDRLMAEIADRHRGQEVIKPAQSQYQPVHSHGTVQYLQRPVQRSLNVMTQGQRDFQNFIKEYEYSKNTTQAIDMSSKSTRETKKPVMPLSRVTPVVPKVPKPGPNVLHCPKKKPEPSLNTFSRLNYHKTKQNEMKNKIQAPKLSTYQEVSSELDEIIKEHQRAKIKVNQMKRENDRVIKPSNVPEQVNKCDTTALGHPLLSNLLQNSSTSSFCRNESSFKSNPVQQAPPVSSNTSLAEKDNMDLINLLRQKNKLNNSHCYSTHVISKPSTSTISKAPPVTSYNPQQTSQTQQLIKTTQGPKTFASTLETKIINVISNTLLKPGHHEINKSISLNVKPQSSSSKLKPANWTVTHDTAKKHVASKEQKKPIPESSKPEWQAVMSDLLRHKTPTRGPNALDVALNKSSFELAFEKSLKEAAKYSQNHSAKEEDAKSIKHHEEVERPKPVIGSVQNVVITKKGIKLQNEVAKQQKDASAKACLKQPVITTNEKIRLQKNTFEPTKKLPQEVQRKQFTYAVPKHVDPFISGIPNSDYDLLEELMDDDLRKEIGELSSDDESYNTAAQSFLKLTKNQASSDRRVSVQFTKCLNESATKPAANVLCVSERQSKKDSLLSETPKIVSQCAHKIAKISHESNSLNLQQNVPNKPQPCNCVTASTSQSALKHIPIMSNAQNLTYDTVKTLPNDQMMFKPNIYISTVSQQTPIQNLVLVGQELVYGGYSNIQTPVQSTNNLSSNTYIAVNSTPMTLYQTTQYTASLAIGTPITVPVMNEVSCTDMLVQPTVADNVLQLSYPPATVERQPTVVDPQTSIETETHIELESQNRVPNCSQSNYKLQEDNKTTERKVLSEVQDFVTTENIEKKLNQETETSIKVHLKMETDADVERLKKKRLAIINREIYHRCEEKIIPLSYSPLSEKIDTVLEKHDFSKAIPLAYASLSSMEDKQKISDSEEEKLLAQIKNNLQDLSDAINEVQSPATPDSNDSKENKSYSELPCRRILLRSSNKITSKSNAERVVSANHTPKKSKAKLKSEVPDANKGSIKTTQEKIDTKETNAPKRASKRLRNKKSTITTEQKKPLDLQLKETDNEVKPSSTNKGKSKLQKETKPESLEYLDVEAELQGTKISKTVKENTNKLANGRSNSANCEEGIVITADKTNENITPYTGTVISAGKTNENTIPETGTALTVDKTNENIIPETGTVLTADKTNENIIPETGTVRTADKSDENIIPETGTVLTADKTNENIIPEKGTVLTADKTNENLIPETVTVMNPDKTNKNIIPETGAAITADKTNENIIPWTCILTSSPQKTTVADKKPKDTTPDDFIDQNTSFSELAAAKPAQDKKKDAIPEVSITQTEQFSQNITKPANEEISSVAVLQKTSDSGQSSQDAVDGQHLSKPIEDLKIDDKSAPEYKSYCDETDSTTSDDSKLVLNFKDSTEVPISSAEALIVDSHDEQPAKKCETTDNKTITDQNKSNLLGKDTIDLDMTVTCEEVPIPKLSPTFGNIKTARNKPINADKKRHVKNCDSIIIKDDSEKNSKEIETPFTISHDIEESKKTQNKTFIEVVNVEPTPDVMLVKRTPKSISEPEVVSSEVPTTKNEAAHMDDDVVIIDDDTDSKPTVSLKERGNKAAGDKINNTEAPIVNSVTTRSNVKTSAVNHGKGKTRVSNVNTTVNSNIADVADLSEIPQSLKDNICIENLPSKDPMTMSVRISLPNGRKVIATVRDKVHFTFDTLLSHPAITKALLNQKNFKKPYVMNVQQIVTMDKSDPNKILSAQINKIETETATNDETSVETIDLLSDDENIAPKIIDTNKPVFVTEYGKFTAPSINKDLFIKHQNKFSQKSRILLKKVDAKSKTQVEKIGAKTNTQDKKADPKSDLQFKKIDAKHSPPKTIPQSPSTSSIPSQYVTGLLNDIKNKLAAGAELEMNTPTVIPEVVEIDDSSNDSICQGKSAETVSSANKTLVDLKNVLLKELGVEETQVSAKSLKEESSNDDVIIVQNTQPPKKRNRRKVPKLTAISSGKSYPFKDLNEEDQQHITKRKCAIKLVRCDDLAIKYIQNRASTKTQSAAHIDEDEPIIITGHTLINGLNENIVETEERSSSPVIEFFDVLVSLNDKSPAHTSAVHQVTHLACAANWLSTKRMLHLQSMDNTSIGRSNVFENYTNVSNDSVTEQDIPLCCEASWLTTKFTLHLQGANDAELVRSYVAYDDEVRDETSDNQAISLFCEANWLTTKPTLHLQANNDNNNCALAQFEDLKDDDDICNDSVMDEVIPLCYTANWDTTKHSLHLQNIKVAALVQSHVPMSHDDEMCFNRTIGPTIPLTCEANWFITKHTLYLQRTIDTTLARSPASEYDKMCDDISVHKEIPLSCEASWLTTKSTLHLQGDNYEVARSNVIDLDKISNGILPHNVTPLVCKAQWFTSKAALHLEAARDVLVMRCNVSNDEVNEKEEPYYRSSTSNVINVTEITPQNAPSFESLELEGFRNTNIILQNTLRKASIQSPINLLKRKSISLQNSAACKISKVNVTSDCPVATVSDIHHSKNILQDNKTSRAESRSKDKTSDGILCATKCDDNHYLKLRDSDEEITKTQRFTKEKILTLDSNTNIDSILINDALFKSHVHEKNDENACGSNKYRSPSPSIKSAIENNSIQYYKNNDPSSDSEPLSPTIFMDPISSTNSYSRDGDSNPCFDTDNVLDEQCINDFDDKGTICKPAEAKESTNNFLEDESLTANPNENSGSDEFDDIEVKLAEIVGEPLVDSNRTQSSPNNKITKKSDSQKSEIIRIILGDDSFINTNGNKIEISVENVEDSSFFKDSDVPIDEYSETATMLDSIEEVICISTEDVMFLSKNESTEDLNREINDMHSNEIVEDIVDSTITNMNSEISDPKKISYQLSNLVNHDINVSTTTDEHCTSQITIKDRDDNTSHQEEENKCQEANEYSAENCVKTTKLLNDVCPNSIVSYLALIRNTSDVLESIVECEDPEAGVCYVIPIIEESSHQNNASAYEDIELRLAEIVGESLEENKNTTSTRVMRLDDKYKTSYSVEVEAITSPEQDAKNIAFQLEETADHENQTLVTSLKAKSDSSAGKKSSLLLTKYVSNVTDTNLKVKIPKHTYTKRAEKIRTCRRSSKRKMDMSDTKTSERKYRKSKNIDYPKFTVAALSETVYAKEYKNLLDYCSSVKFSFSVPFHKEHIDVHEMLKSWPINDNHPQKTEQSLEPNENLFAEIEKSEMLSDPLEQTLPEEIISKFDENSYTPSNIRETNFNMGFGERSGRVIQESKDGEFTTFSAATLSDVKQLQPLLPSDKITTLVPTNCVDEVHDQKLKAKRFLDNLNVKNKVRSFFEKTKAELDVDRKFSQKKDYHENYTSIWPFGDLVSTRNIETPRVEVIANVVQVGQQLPVSAAAQNPVTCDPRVTHVSNASPSQCSPGNSLGDELQTTIKTEYTELTTADITLPLMQEYVQHHSMPSESQEPTNLYSANESSPMATQMSVVKIELMDETSQENNVDYENDGFQQLPNGGVSNSIQYNFENIVHNVATESDPTTIANSSKTLKTTFSEDKQSNDIVGKPDQLAHAMNAAGISATKGFPKSDNCVPPMQQSPQPNVVTQSQVNANNFSKGTPINAIALQQALSQILPPPLNQTSTSENNSQTSTNPQVLHIVQGNNSQSVINKPNGTQLLHIVQNKNAANTNGTPAPQQNTFSGLSIVDGAIQQSGNQLLHIVNTANQKNTNAGQLLKRVNLLTNLANVQGSNEQKMVQFVCKSADGKSIQLPQQRSMVLRFQPLDPSNVPTTPKQNENQDLSSTSGTNEKESSSQDMKSRSLYEENYAKFVQNDPKFIPNGDSKLGPEKATSLPKFNQVFGKQVYQEKQNEMDSDNLPENSEPPEDNNPQIEQMNDMTNPPMLIRKPNTAQPSHVQPNLVQQIKQTIGPMNIQTMHGGVIYTRQIPVNIGNGQTINLITVPSTELLDDSTQKQQTDAKFGSQDGDPPIIKLVQTNQPSATPNGSTDDNNGPIRSTNDANPQPNPQPVLTQMRIKLPMLSKAPQMVGGTRVVRPSFFQIQRNVIGGANQQVYQQLVLTAAPPMGQSIRVPTQMQKPKTPSDNQSSPESQMSSSTLEQLREFDMVLEQVKERSTVQPGTSTSSTNNFTKLKSSPDTTDSRTPGTSTQESPTQVLYSVGNTQPLNMVNFVNRKSTITSTTTTSFVRSPDSTGTVESPPSSTQSHLPHTVTSDSCASSCASEAAAATVAQPKPKKKKPKPSTSNSNPFNIKNTPKPSTQKPLEDEQTTQRILYILAEYKEQVENSPDKDKPAPRRRNNPATPNAGSSKRKKSGSRRRDMSPVLGEDSCRTMGSEDSSCGTSLGECNECLESHSPEESPKKVVRRLTFEQETQITQTRTTTTTTTIPQRNVIVTDGQAFALRGPTGKPATTVLMPANYLLPVSMVKGGQQIAIVTNRGPKLLVGAGDGASGGTLLFQRLIGPGGLKPVLARTGVRHIRLPTAALHNLQAFNIATPTAVNIQPPDSTASPAPAPAPPDLVDTRAMSSPWPDRDAGEVKPERGNSSPEGSEPWNLPSSSIADDYGYEEIVRTDNMDRTVLDAIPDRYSPDLEAQRIFDKMFDSDSKKTMYDSRCGYDIDASDDDKAYHQVVHRKDGRQTTRLTHVSAAALRHKYAILEHELRLQKSLSEECEDLGVDSPSASELFPEAELLFAPSPAYEQTIDQCHTPQPTIHAQGIPQPDLDDQIATDHLLTHKERHDNLDINLDDVGEIVTVGEDGMTTIPLDHEEFARSHEEFARSHPNTTFHSEPEDGEVPPFTIAQSIKGRQITYHSRGVPGTVVMAPQTTVISQATIEATGSQNPVKFSDIDNMINAMPNPHHPHINMPSVLKETHELTKFDRLLHESRELNLSNTASAIVHSTGNGTQVIRRVQYERRDSRYLVEEDAMIAGDTKVDERRDMMDDTSSSERHPELFWDTHPRPERKRFDFSSDSDKCPYDELNSDSSGIGAHMRLDSVIKAARTERRRYDGSSPEETHPPLRTYPPKRTYQHTHHDIDRSVTGKTRASDRCHDVKDESRRRASNRGVVKRGCHCCNGSTPPKPKKSRPKKTSEYPQN